MMRGYHHLRCGACGALVLIAKRGVGILHPDQTCPRCVTWLVDIFTGDGQAAKRIVRQNTADRVAQ